MTVRELLELRKDRDGAVFRLLLEEAPGHAVLCPRKQALGEFGDRGVLWWESDGWAITLSLAGEEGQ